MLKIKKNEHYVTSNGTTVVTSAGSSGMLHGHWPDAVLLDETMYTRALESRDEDRNIVAMSYKSPGQPDLLVYLD